jgi:Acetyltransferase (GNAT) domain
MTSDPAPPPGTGSLRRYRASVPAPRSEWRAAFLADPNAQAFHSPEWVAGVCATGGFEDASRVYATPDDRLLVLPMVRRCLLGGAVTVQASLPAHWGVGGVLSREAVTPEDLTAVCADLRRQPGVLRTSLQPVSRTAATWAKAELPGVKRIPRLSHVLDLEGGFETVWAQRFTKTARKGVRKAEKAGVVVEHDSTGARLPEYWAVLEESIERWAKQQHEPWLLSRWRARQRETLPKMRALAAALPSRFHLYLAVLDGRAIAGIVVWHGAGARTTNGAMIKDLAGPVAANYLLDRVAIEDACAAGSTHYDFGESGTSSGLAMYKTRFGARPEPYESYVIERLPLTEVDGLARRSVKRLIGFEESTATTRHGDPHGPA